MLGGQTVLAEEITEEAITAHLDTRGLPDPDLLIRTGGEHRISNFLVWQAAYCEYHFTGTAWPDFGPAEVDAALAVRFADEVPVSVRHSRKGNPGKAYLDLRGILRDQLIAAGVPAGRVTSAGPCTRCASDQCSIRP